MYKDIINIFIFYMFIYFLKHNNIFVVFFYNMMIFLRVIHAFSVRFLDNKGFDLTNVFDENQFTVLLETSSTSTMLKVQNHPYITSLPIYRDPCKFKVIGIKTYQKGLGGGRVEEKYNFNKGENFLVNGLFDACEREVKYTLGDVEYKYRRLNSFYKMYKKLIDTSKIDIPESSPKNYKVFIINDLDRAQRHQSKIGENTENLISHVNAIFKRSNSPFGISLIGLLNFKKYFTDIISGGGNGQFDTKSDILKIFDEKSLFLQLKNEKMNLLESFRNLVERTR